MPEQVTTSEPLAVTLCRATNLWPAASEDYTEFMVEKLLPAFDSLSEEQTKTVPQAAADWAWKNIEAFNNGNPLEECPGFDNVYDVEDRTPMFQTIAGEEEHEKPVRGKGKGRRRNGKGKDAKSSTQTSRVSSDGKAWRIMDEIFANPRISVDQIMNNLAKEKIQCAKQSTTVVRSFYRKAWKHLAAQGALKHPPQF